MLRKTAVFNTTFGASRLCALCWNTILISAKTRHTVYVKTRKIFLKSINQKKKKKENPWAWSYCVLKENILKGPKKGDICGKRNGEWIEPHLRRLTNCRWLIIIIITMIIKIIINNENSPYSHHHNVITTVREASSVKEGLLEYLFLCVFYRNMHMCLPMWGYTKVIFLT